MSHHLEYSIVVPVYNSGALLTELVERLEDVFRNTVKAKFEILLVDDGSTRTETRECLDVLTGRAGVTVLVLTRNFGKAGAVLCGLSHSRGDWVITIDDDLQQRPEDIPELIKLREHDVVSATHSKKHHTPVQRVTSRVKRQFDRWILQESAALSPLKLIRRHVVDGMIAVETNRPFIPALIRQVTQDVVAVETAHAPSAYNKSRYTLGQRWAQFSNLLIGNSDMVLSAFAALGYFLALSSLALILVIIARKLFGFPIEPGWSSLMIAILGIGGLQLVAIGITGQYLIRILDISSKKPAYLVREIRPIRDTAGQGES